MAEASEVSELLGAEPEGPAEGLIEFVAQQLGVAKHCVRIVAGSNSRKKRLEIDGVTPGLIAARLA
jgi:uncharacterized protein YggU (UPF0235/DUF167 family)